MKQNEQENDEKTESSQWQAPILDEIDVALFTQFTPGANSDGITSS